VEMVDELAMESVLLAVKKKPTGWGGLEYLPRGELISNRTVCAVKGSRSVAQFFVTSK
jgi:hypothetical protein